MKHNKFINMNNSAIVIILSEYNKSKCVSKVQGIANISFLLLLFIIIRYELSKKKL